MEIEVNGLKIETERHNIKIDHQKIRDLTELDKICEEFQVEGDFVFHPHRVMPLPKEGDHHTITAYYGREGKVYQAKCIGEYQADGTYKKVSGDDVYNEKCILELWPCAHQKK